MDAISERKVRLRQAAGAAIEAAIATGADPFDLMRAVTGEGDNICGPYVQQHPFFTEKRQQFKTCEDRRLDALAAEPGPIVWVRRQFSSRKHAAYRLSDVDGWHRSNMSGGIVRRANRYYLHGYVWCDALIAGKLGHTCQHGPPPHHIKVCVTKKGNEKFWGEIEKVAKAGDGKGRRGETSRRERGGMLDVMRSGRVAKRTKPIDVAGRKAMGFLQVANPSYGLCLSDCIFLHSLGSIFLEHGA